MRYPAEVSYGDVSGIEHISDLVGMEFKAESYRFKIEKIRGGPFRVRVYFSFSGQGESHEIYGANYNVSVPRWGSRKEF